MVDCLKCSQIEQYSNPLIVTTGPEQRETEAAAEAEDPTSPRPLGLPPPFPRPVEDEDELMRKMRKVRNCLHLFAVLPLTPLSIEAKIASQRRASKVIPIS